MKRKWIYKMGKLLYGFILLSGLVFVICAGENDQRLQEQLSTKVLRFHVIANSNSKKDQDIKLLVRDAVGTELEPLLAEATNLSDTCQIVSEHMDMIVDTAERTLKENGSMEKVQAFLTKENFPVKEYGNYEFPEGEYQALELIIGKGRGKNWWCVLYPNLCFRGSMYEVVDEEAKKELKEILTMEEYAKILKSGDFHVRLKILEHFKKNS